MDSYRIPMDFYRIPVDSYGFLQDSYRIPMGSYRIPIESLLESDWIAIGFQEESKWILIGYLLASYRRILAGRIGRATNGSREISQDEGVT